MTQIGIIGYGSQAKAFAHNLRDSGHHITILLRSKSTSLAHCQQDGFDVMDYESQEIPNELSFLLLLTPDKTHGAIIEKVSHQNPGRNFCFAMAHGYSFIKEDLKESFPSQEFALFAPKAIASEVRSRFLKKEKLIGVLDVDHCPGFKELVHQLSKDMGFTQVIQSSFKDEAQADLFSEQTLLCSLLPYGARKSYEFLVEKGVDPDLAFVECWMEVKLIADAMLQHGPVGYLNLISENAFIGGEKAQAAFFDGEYQKKLDSLWNDIEKGSFFHEIDAMNMAELKEKVHGEWANHPLQKSFDKFAESSDEKGSHNKED